MGNDEETWEDLARKVTEAGADMIEMNLSCPQMTSHAMGSDVGSNAELCKKYCAAVKRGSKLPMMAKMTPNITDMVPVAKACLEGGADGKAGGKNMSHRILIGNIYQHFSFAQTTQTTT